MDHMQGRTSVAIHRKNISQLPAKITQEIERSLDHNPETCSWRAFLKIASTLRDDYEFSQVDIESKFGRFVFGNGSPTNRLISELGARGMIVAELVQVLDELRLENLLIDLKPYEEIQITRQPAEMKHLEEGDQLELHVEAVGFPYPRYQWFKLDGKEYNEINGAKHPTYRISRTCLGDSGTYCCRLHNGGTNDHCKFSQPSTVKVHYRPTSTTETPNPMKETVDNHEPSKPVLPQVLTQPEDVYVHVQDKVELTCEGIGHKPLTYEWLKNGKLIDSNKESGKLTFPDVTMKHQGIYTCVIRNQFGKVHSREVTVEVNQEAIIRDYRCEGIDIILNPKTCSVEVGGNCLFSVDARCKYPLTYKWYKDHQAWDCEQKDLHFYNLQDHNLQGTYQCVVTCPKTKESVLSHPACLSIKCPTNLSRSEYRATDKVALLIGNYDYMNETTLKAPSNDVAKMAEAFRSLEFKVVSLLNLTKQEMNAAIHEYCNLLGKGVYGVFYFCGHGFEENGQCYFVPPDARSGYTIEDCISSNDVLRAMQKSDPALVTLILDICRIKNKIPSKPPSNSGGVTGRESPGMPDPKGNCVSIYATSEGMFAYEDHENGILVKYLQKFIYQNKPVSSFFHDVIDAWSQDPQHCKLQKPEIRSTLMDWRRSLSDRILTTGHTQAFYARTQMWLKAHETPKPQEIRIPELGNLVVELTFQMEFSNVLHLIAAIKNPGNTYKSIAFPYDWPKSISMMGDIKNVTHTPLTRSTSDVSIPRAITKSTFQDLQKLKDNMELKIVVKYCLKDGVDKHYLTDKINLGLPLIANLHLYNRVTEPIEHIDES
ncbi:mucosa-associated lymphoid tissue lymphoma translocation protein 1-like [Pecten maximus]|uniref:mucosa-associated lymphoid tissue lymphoma translocation protein 1-like n=1 Tax=Pecten maximus TaxID=6579 RepID=UPI0014581878|nr:mucosa-associated lymphoid tissue lymphoma translocation protein 1-like [Pecten maximus]